MKTVQKLMKAAMVNYHGRDKQNEIRMATEYGTDEYFDKVAGKLKEQAQAKARGGEPWWRQL